MLTRACAVSLLTVASLVSSAGAASSANASTPADLAGNASDAAGEAHWERFLECFTPSARKQLLVSLARPVFGAASADRDLESELERRLRSLGASCSTVLSGSDLSRQARFVELLVAFAQQNHVEIDPYWTGAGTFRVNPDKSVALVGSKPENGVPTSFSVVKFDGGFRFAMQPDTGTNVQAASGTRDADASWIAPGQFPSLRDALSAMSSAPAYTPDSAWSAGVPATQPDVDPGQTVLAAFPAPNGSNVHVCMVLGVRDGRARLLTTDGTLVEGVPGALVCPIDTLSQHIGRGPKAGEPVLAFRSDGASFFGTIARFDNGAPVVTYYDSDDNRTETSRMCAVVPVNQGQCAMYQMVAFECAGGVETGLCVAQTDGHLWLITSGELTLTPHHEAQLLTWTGTDTRAGLERFRGVSGAHLASADLLRGGQSIELQITPDLMTFPAYAVGGVDTDNAN